MRAAAFVVILLTAGCLSLPMPRPLGVDGTLTLPAVHVGDSGVYMGLRLNVTGEVVEEHVAMEFQILPARTILDGDGSWRGVNQVRQVEYRWTSFNLGGQMSAGYVDRPTVYSVDAGDGSSVARTSEGGFMPDDDRWQHYTVYGSRHDVPACGLLSPMQGATTRLDTPVAIPTGCRLDVLQAAWSSALDNFELVPIAKERLDGRDTVQFKSGSMSMWLAEDVPYPIKVEFPGRNETRVIELTEFQRGKSPLVPPPASIAPAPPAIVRAPVTWLGPDESGLEIGFPLAHAVAVARDDPTFPDVREFMESRPGAYVGLAYYSDTYQEGAETSVPLHGQRSWSFVLTDGDDAVSVAVRQERAVPLVADLAGPASAVYILDHGLDLDFFRFEFPKKEDLPDTAPTPASLFAAWKSYGMTNATGVPFPAWDFRVSCAQDCDASSIQIRAGVFADTCYAADAGGQSGCVRRMSALGMHGDGVLSLHEIVDEP